MEGVAHQAVESGPDGSEDGVGRCPGREGDAFVPRFGGAEDDGRAGRSAENVEEGEGEVFGDGGGEGQGERWDDEGLEELGGFAVCGCIVNIIWLISISFR